VDVLSESSESSELGGIQYENCNYPKNTTKEKLSS